MKYHPSSNHNNVKINIQQFEVLEQGQIPVDW